LSLDSNIQRPHIDVLPPLPVQPSTFRIAPSSTLSAPALDQRLAELGEADDGCANCRGGSASMAWDTVGLLRAENRELKGRVGELEEAVTGALDVVMAVGL
jgi:hypothetical protein